MPKGTLIRPLAFAKPGLPFGKSRSRFGGARSGTFSRKREKENLLMPIIHRQEILSLCSGLQLLSLMLFHAFAAIHRFSRTVVQGASGVNLVHECGADS